MADKKADKKVFDVTKPGKGKVDIGSKPMIVGHKSMATDPMMRSDAEPEEQIDETTEKVSQTSKVTILPMSDQQNSSDADKTEGAPELPADTILASNPIDLKKSDTVEDHISDEEEKQNDNDSKPAKKEVSEPEEAAEPKEDSDSKETAPKQENDKATDDKIDDKPADSDDVKTEEEKKDEKKSEEDKQLDPSAVAMERDENLQKLIDSKTYRLDIKESSSSEGRSKKVLVALAAVLVGLAGLFVAIDTKALDIGIDMPFSLFGKDDPEPINDLITHQEQDQAKQASEKATDETSSNENYNVLVDTDTLVEGGLKSYQNKEQGVDFVYDASWKRYESTIKDERDTFLTGTWFETEDYVPGEAVGISEGAIIFFEILRTTVKNSAERVDNLKNPDDDSFAYYFPETIETVEINDQPVIRYNSGHHSGGVTYEWIIDGKQYALTYSSNIQPGSNDYEEEKNYADFLEVLESVSFVEPQGQ